MYLKNLKVTKGNKKLSKTSKKQNTKRPKSQSSSESEHENTISYAESDDSPFEPEEEGVEEARTDNLIQLPSSENIVLGRYVIVRSTEKRAVSHRIGIIINKEEDFVEIKCLKRCTGYTFELVAENNTIKLNYDYIVGILKFPKIVADNKLEFFEDLRDFKNIG